MWSWDHLVEQQVDDPEQSSQQWIVHLHTHFVLCKCSQVKLVLKVLGMNVQVTLNLTVLQNINTHSSKVSNSRAGQERHVTSRKGHPI